MSPDCCKPILHHVVDRDEATGLARLFGVLADPVRLRLFSLIAGRPGQEACACELVGELDRSQPTISHHLKVLHEAGLLDRERRGNWIHYKVVPARVGQLREALAVGYQAAD